MKFLARVVLGIVGVIVVGMGLAITLGGPSDASQPAPASITEPLVKFAKTELSDLPPTSYFVARDGTKLAYRAYHPIETKPLGSIVLLHGISVNKRVMHVLAKSFAAAGFTAYALDIRGHGESGELGHIAYLGQLDDDMEDFVRSVNPASPVTLAGYSMSGGLALRIAGSARRQLFDNYLLLAPSIGPDAPTLRRDAVGWESIGKPRFIAIALLDTVGVHAFDDLPVLRLPSTEDAKKSHLTSTYSFALAVNCFPERGDYRAAIRTVDRPLRVVVGRDDELFYADRYAEVFKAEGKDVPVTVVPGIQHVPLVLEPAPVQAAIEAVRAMD